MKKVQDWRFTATLLLSLNVLACSPPKADPAVLAYRQLVTELTLGSSDGLWSLLSMESRRMLAERLKLERTPDKAPPNLALELDWAFESPFVGQASSVLIDDKSQSETARDPQMIKERRVVQTIYASQPWLIPVVFESGQWRVHLLGARQKKTPQ